MSSGSAAARPTASGIAGLPLLVPLHVSPAPGKPDLRRYLPTSDVCSGNGGNHRYFPPNGSYRQFGGPLVCRCFPWSRVPVMRTRHAYLPRVNFMRNGSTSTPGTGLSVPSGCPLPMSTPANRKEQPPMQTCPPEPDTKAGRHGR